jgi:hypothetical protein
MRAVSYHLGKAKYHLVLVFVMADWLMLYLCGVNVGRFDVAGMPVAWYRGRESNPHGVATTGF